MIITISGQIGTGKSIIGKELAKKINCKYISTGEIFKKLAKERKMGLTEFLKYAEKNLLVDKELDEKQKELKGNYILDSRMGFHFAKPYLNIWLKASLGVRVKRIANRDSLDLEETEKQIREREETERGRYKRLYSVDISDFKNYDLIIDTTNLTIEQMLDKILDFIKKKN